VNRFARRTAVVIVAFAAAAGIQLAVSAAPADAAVKRTVATKSTVVKKKKKAAGKPTAKKSAANQPTAQTTATATATAGQTTVESQVITLVNQQRKAAGCGAVVYNAKLRTAAYNHSLDMATHNFFDHTGSDGSTFVTRVQAAGYSAPLGENIAWGWRTPADVMNAWMNSAPHKANILNCSARSIGVGMAKKADGTPYWTQEFGAI
jgi:uncharacterized protein YkwD